MASKLKQQILVYIESNPTATAVEIADRFGCCPTYAYKVALMIDKKLNLCGVGRYKKAHSKPHTNLLRNDIVTALSAVPRTESLNAHELAERFGCSYIFAYKTAKDMGFSVSVAKYTKEERKKRDEQRRENYDRQHPERQREREWMRSWYWSHAEEISIQRKKLRMGMTEKVEKIF